MPEASLFTSTLHGAAHELRLQRTHTGLRLLNTYIVSDVESECSAVKLDGLRWWDTRPMLDMREHSPEVVDLAREVIAYALDVGLALQHTELPYLVRFHPPASAPVPQGPLQPRLPSKLAEFGTEAASTGWLG